MLRRAVLVTLALGLSLAAGAGLVFSQGAPVKVGAKSGRNVLKVISVEFPLERIDVFWN